MLALIDADILVHRVGFTTENDEEWIAKARFDEMMDGILQNTQANAYRLYLSDKTANNFRTKYYPEYKANRKQPKPKHYDAIKVHAIKEWQATITPNQEADDQLGIDQYSGYWDDPWGAGWILKHDSTICSIDKDLHQIPGLHFNFVSGESREVSPVQGMRHFYYQLLKGDSSDNIQGCPGIGEKKAQDYLPKEATNEEYFDLVLKKYIEQYQKKIFKTDAALSHDSMAFVLKQLLLNGICLKIRTKEDEVWEFPRTALLSQMGEELLKSIKPMPEETTPSTELT